MAEVVKFRIVKSDKAAKAVNAEAVTWVTELLERLKAGTSTSVATVDVNENGTSVTTFYSNGGQQYHPLCSGCSRLSTLIASEKS